MQDGFKFRISQWVMIYNKDKIAYSGINFTNARLGVVSHVYKNNDLPVIHTRKYDLN